MTSPPDIPRVAVGAIVFSGDHVLLVQRATPPGAGLWTVPGGKLEPGETLAAAVAREVREATGLTVTCGRLVDVIERVSPGFHYVILDYLATLTAAANDSAPTPTAGDDVSAARWVASADLASLPLTEGLVPVLERARALVVSAGVPR
jgi:8-oxo-dGTP diphosphatase